MLAKSLENISIGQEKKHPAEGTPQPLANVAPKEKENRIAAHELFTLFTATIMLKNEPFVR